MSDNPIVVTHDGQFHADEIFGCAVIKNIFPNARIIRSRDAEIIASGNLVLDVGGIYDTEQKRFDHHQVGGAGTRENTVPYASFGLIWKQYGPELCDHDDLVWKMIDQKLVQPIDARDCGMDIVTSVVDELRPYSIENLFGTFAPTWRERTDENADELLDTGFFRCLEIAEHIIKREVVIARDTVAAERLVRNLYTESSDKRLVVSDVYIPRAVWYQFADLFPELLYIVVKRDSDHWNIIAQRQHPNDMPSRKPFPVSWGGLRDDALVQETGVSGALFCHNGRFLCTASDRESALELVRQALIA